MWVIYIWKGKVFVPSQFKTEAGFYLSGEPVHVSNLTDLEGTKQSIAQVLNRGCPNIATPPVKQLEKWVVLQHAGASSTATFEKSALCWTIQKSPATYRFGRVKKLSPRGWETEPDRPYFLAYSSSVDEVASQAARAIHDGNKI
jgi:hypothetical protein